jgi:hypothetical protein
MVTLLKWLAEVERMASCVWIKGVAVLSMGRHSNSDQTQFGRSSIVVGSLETFEESTTEIITCVVENSDLNWNENRG